MKECKGCGESLKGIWLSEEGLCSVCYHNKHKKREDDIDWLKPSLQATCFICLEPIYKKRLSYIHFLWSDDLYEGLPICDTCYFELIDKINPKYIDYDVREYELPIIVEKKGLEKWL